MRASFFLARFAVGAIAILAAASAAADREAQFVHIPASSVHDPKQAGVSVHTNYEIYTGPPFNTGGSPLLAEMPSHGPALFHLLSLPSGFHPSDIRSAYGDNSNGGGAIALIDAYDYGTALNDFNVFSGEFGLPQERSTNPTASSNAVFQVVYAYGFQPSGNAEWNMEAALDVEWAHAMAPGAKIYLVEAMTSNTYDVCYAASIASQLPGVRQVSLSWGSAEFSSESSYDSTLTQNGVSFFAAAGDTGAVPLWPSTSPNVIGVGGTSLTLSNGSYGSETPWTSGGGGVSAYESSPHFQSGLGLARRGAPDISAVADPYTGVSIYDSTPYESFVNWTVVGGTSAASPIAAGLANAGVAGRGAGELPWIYLAHSLFHDITTLGTGPYTSGGETYYTNPAKVGYDLATGWGSPLSTRSL